MGRVRASLNLKREEKKFPPRNNGGRRKSLRTGPELNEKEVIEVLENATPGSMKKAMKIIQCKNLPKLYFDNLSIRVSQRKTMQVATIYTLKNYLYIAHPVSSPKKVEKICLISWGRF